MRTLTLTTLILVVAVGWFAPVATAQYMYLDSNGNGVHEAGDVLSGNGTPTTVDVWILTNQNRDGSIAECNVDPSLPLNMNSYVVNLRALNGNVTYGGFINNFPAFTTGFGEVNAGAGQYKNGFGGPASAAVGPGGPFKVCTITITGISGSPSIIINDINTDSQDFTSFGTRCDGNDFDSTYKLAGPGGGSDWTDVDGLPAGDLNQPPVLNPIGNRIVDEGTCLTFTATASDPDAGQSLTFSLGGGAPQGAGITPAGGFTWCPTEAQGPGTYAVTVCVTDNGTPQQQDCETFTITVNEVNVAPVLAAIGNKAGVAGEQVTFTATATDADIPTNTLTFTLDAGAPVGAAITSGGIFTWTPTCDQGGTHPVTIRVTDNGAPPLNDSETIAITISAANQPPVLAAIGNKTVNEGSLLAFTATAIDPCAQTLTFSLDAGAPAGATIGASSGAFTWTPTEGQGPGVFSITVRVTNEGSPAISDFETIQVTVDEVNVAPVLAPIGNITQCGVGDPITFTATATDADIPANGLTFSLTLGSPPATGATINATTGAFSWTPSAMGTFPITINVTDNGAPPLTDSETITMTVGGCPNTEPVLAAIGNKTVNEQTLLAFTATATDPDAGQTLTFSLDPGAPVGATIGASSGAFNWIPNEAQGPGVFSITVRVTDNGDPALSDFETIQVTVNEVNLPPVMAAIGNKSVCEGVLLSFAATCTDPDIPANTLTFTLGAGAPPGATITSGGNFNWTPTEAQGPGSFPITICCADNGSPPLQDCETFTVTVLECDGHPILAPIGNKTVNELSLLTFTATATDSDIPAQTLTFSLGAGAPAGATITAGGVFNWTPTEAQGPGSFPITVIVTDNGTPAQSDSETITVQVNEVNSPPVLAQIGNKTVNEGTQLCFTVASTDGDIPANTLTCSITGAPPGATFNAATGEFCWTPTEAQGPGTYTITICCTDNGSPPLQDCETFTITVNEGNVAPVLAPIGNKVVCATELLTFTAAATDADIPANTLTCSLDSGAPVGASIDPGTCVFSWTPTAAQSGTHAATVRVTDNGVPPLSDSETISITVPICDAPPVLQQPADMTLDEGTTADQQLAATDPEGRPLTFSLVSGPPFMTVTTTGATTGNIHLAPDFGDAGVYTATVRVTDPAGISDTKSFQITVNNVCRPPAADADGPYAGVKDVPVNFDGTGSSSPDGSPLTFLWDFGDGGTGSGATPSHSYAATGTYLVTLQVSDDCGFGDDVTTATIADCFTATAFTRGGNNRTSLGSGKPFTCVQIQPNNGAYANDNVDLSSIVMISEGTGSVGQISAVSGKTVVDADRNGDGIQEITACFAKEDLRLLFSGLPSGNNTVEVTLEGNLVGGGSFCTTLTHVVKGTGGGLSASVTPNPLNPSAALTFATTKAGRVKVQLFDVRGRLMRTLLDDGTAPAGYHDVEIDGRDANGMKLASGVYYILIESTADGRERLAITILK